MGTGERKVVFFKKKKQKTFIRWDIVIWSRGPNVGVGKGEAGIMRLCILG
jgi:hypothetical protein